MPNASRGPLSAGRWAWEWTKSILIAFSLFVLIRTFLVEAFRIPTGSMENTLLVGDFLLVNKAVYGAEVPGTHLRLPAFTQPRRGDIVVFVPPHEPDKNYVKRLVGLPGDEPNATTGADNLNAHRNDQARHAWPKPRWIWVMVCLAVKKFLGIDGAQWAGAFAFNAWRSEKHRHNKHGSL